MRRGRSGSTGRSSSPPGMIRACSPGRFSSRHCRCSWPPPARLRPRRRPAASAPRIRATNVSFQAAGGARLKGAVLGRGSTGVVLAHTTSADRCQWLPFARELAKQGYRALVFDHRGYGASTGVTNTDPHLDVIAAAAELRRRGAKKIVLAGASMGGTGVVAAAPVIRPAISGVVELSAPTAFSGANALAAVKKLEASGAVRRRPRRRRLPGGYTRSLQGGGDEGQAAPHRAVVLARRRSRVSARGAQARARLRRARRLGQIFELAAVTIELRLLGCDDILRSIRDEALVREHALGARDLLPAAAPAPARRCRPA